MGHGLALGFWFLTQSQHHFSSATTLAVASVDPKKVVPVQAQLFLIFQSTGVLMACALYGAVQAQNFEDYFENWGWHAGAFVVRFLLTAVIFQSGTAWYLGRKRDLKKVSKK